MNEAACKEIFINGISTMISAVNYRNGYKAIVCCKGMTLYSTVIITNNIAVALDRTEIEYRNRLN